MVLYDTVNESIDIPIYSSSAWRMKVDRITTRLGSISGIVFALVTFQISLNILSSWARREYQKKFSTSVCPFSSSHLISM